AERREQHAHVVVDLGDGPDRGAGMRDGGALLDRDRGAEARDGLDLVAVHLLEELSRPRREAFDVAALPLGVQRVEGEAALAGARGSRDHHQAIPGDVAVEALQVVDPGPPDGDRLVPGVALQVRTKTPFYRTRAPFAARNRPC